MSARRLLVTGASGFLGRHVLAATVGRYEVVALAGRRGVPDDLAARCARVATGDIGDDELVSNLVAGVDMVCHLAAHIPARHDDPAEAAPCVAANAVATLRLAQHSLAGGVSRFVYASAGTLYAVDGRPARESDPVYPATRATYYLASKLLGELYVEHLRLTEGLPAVSLRISSPYGPGMPSASLVAQLVERAQSGDPLEVRHGGVPAVDLVCVGDVTACLVAALEAGEPGVYNVGGGRAWSLLEIAEVVRAATGSRSGIVVVPAADVIPASFPAIDVRKANEAWGFTPTPLQEGIRQMSAVEAHG